MDALFTDFIDEINQDLETLAEYAQYPDDIYGKGENENDRSVVLDMDDDIIYEGDEY